MAVYQRRRVGSPVPYAACDVLAMAASLGGLHALSQILAALPPDFPAAIACCSKPFGRRSASPSSRACDCLSDVGWSPDGRSGD